MPEEETQISETVAANWNGLKKDNILCTTIMDPPSEALFEVIHQLGFRIMYACRWLVYTQCCRQVGGGGGGGGGGEGAKGAVYPGPPV